MSPSRPFILRPVATSLLMAAIMLVGIVAYTQLPVSALPEVDYPTIQVLTFYPGASPDVVATTVTAPAGTSIWRNAGSEPDDLHQLRRHLGGGAAVQPLAQHRHRGRRSAIGHQRRPELPAREPARTPDLQQDQPCRRARADPGHHLENPAPLPGGRSGRHPPGAQDLPAQWRGPGQHQRRSEAGGAHPGESGAAAELRHRSGSGTHRPGFRQRESGQGQLRRAAPELSDRRQRSADHQRRLQECGGRLSQQCSGLSARRRHTWWTEWRTPSKRPG